MLIIQAEIHKEGMALGISANSGKIWGEYFVCGERAEKFFLCIADIVNAVDPLMGDKFSAKVMKLKKKKGKK